MITQADIDAWKELHSHSANGKGHTLEAYESESSGQMILYGDGDAVASDMWGNIAYGVSAEDQAKYMAEASNHFLECLEEIERLRKPLAHDVKHVVGNAVFALETNLEALKKRYHRVLGDRNPKRDDCDEINAIMDELSASVEKIKAFLQE